MADTMEPKKNIIPEIIERNHFMPVAEAFAAFATAYMKVGHKVKGCAFEQNKDNLNSMNVSIQMDISLPVGTQLDYITMNIPIVVPLPKGTLFVPESSESV
jgi:hypothetical protein